jgi:hypothetical protein
LVHVLVPTGAAIRLPLAVSPALRGTADNCGYGGFVGQSRRTDDTQRFRSRYSDADLRHIVGVIVRELAGSGRDIRTVTDREFEQALAGSARPDCPKADRICRRLRLTWPALVDLLASPERDVDFNVALAGREASTRRPDEDEAVYALRLIASHLGSDSLNPASYSAGAESFIEPIGGRGRRRAGPAPSLPTVEQIVAACGSWDRALELASLQSRVTHPGRPGASLESAIEGFLADVGCLPWSGHALRVYARQRDISIASIDVFAREIRRFIGQRLYGPSWVPFAAPLPGERPGIDVAADPRPAVRRRRKNDWRDREALIAGLVRAHDLARERNRPLTQKYHRALATEHGDIPHPSIVQRRSTAWGTTAKRLRDEALALSMSARQSAA